MLPYVSPRSSEYSDSTCAIADLFHTVFGSAAKPFTRQFALAELACVGDSNLQTILWLEVRTSPQGLVG
jgi:hypothetical protein